MVRAKRCAMNISENGLLKLLTSNRRLIALSRTTNSSPLWSIRGPHQLRSIKLRVPTMSHPSVAWNEGGAQGCELFCSDSAIASDSEIARGVDGGCVRYLHR